MGTLIIEGACAQDRGSHLHRTPGGCGPPLTKACTKFGSTRSGPHTSRVGERILSRTWTEEQLLTVAPQVVTGRTDSSVPELRQERRLAPSPEAYRVALRTARAVATQVDRRSLSETLLLGSWEGDVRLWAAQDLSRRAQVSHFLKEGPALRG